MRNSYNDLLQLTRPPRKDNASAPVYLLSSAEEPSYSPCSEEDNAVMLVPTQQGE